MKTLLLITLLCLFVSVRSVHQYSHEHDDDDDSDGDEGGHYHPRRHGYVGQGHVHGQGHGHGQGQGHGQGHFQGHGQGHGYGDSFPSHRRPVSHQEHSDIEKLYIYLTRHHHQQTRPCRYTSCDDASQVRFTMSPISFEFDMEDSYLYTNYWLKITYTDHRLTWDPRDFGGISSIRVPQEELWMPDLEVFNDARGGEDRPWSPRYLAVVSSDGTVLVVPKGSTKTWCHFNETESEQHCEVKFGSWTYAEKEVDVQIYDAQTAPPDCDQAYLMGVASKHGDWKMTKCRQERHSATYDCCPDDHYVDVTFYLSFSGSSDSF